MATTFGKGSHLHLIDGSHFIFRAYYALPALTRKSDGLPVGAVRGFCGMLHKLITDNNGHDAPTHIAVLFDKGPQTFRNTIYSDYKANRDEMPEDLRPQMPLTRVATTAFNIVSYEKEGFEADDIIATLATKARAAGGRVTIISSDKDLMQLVGDGVEMFDTMRNRRIDRNAVKEKFGVFPDRVVDVQALAGDSIDNVPGAPGIGLKIAAALINEFGDLGALLDRADEVPQQKRRETLINYREQIEMSRELVKLDQNMNIDFGLEDLDVQEPDPERLQNFLTEMEFHTLMKRIAPYDQPTGRSASASRLAGEQGGQTDATSFDHVSYDCIVDQVSLARWVASIEERGWVALSAKAAKTHSGSFKLAGISLCVEPGTSCYIPTRPNLQSSDELFDNKARLPQVLTTTDVLHALNPILSDDSILKIGHNIKTDAKVLVDFGISITSTDDTMLMSYALHGGEHEHGIISLSDRYLNFRMVDPKSIMGSGKTARTFDQISTGEAVSIAAQEADVILRLWKKFKIDLWTAGVTTVYETLERPLIPVLTQMERAGIGIDRMVLQRLSERFAKSMMALESEIHILAGEQFNVGSPRQLGEILFDKLGLEGGKRGKSGAYSTGADLLEDLAVKHELPARVLDWRQLAKLKSTYTDALQSHVNPSTGRVHTSYTIAGASTGRLASVDPNLQNIPIRTEDGRSIREAFVADSGRYLISLDYSQIELRILAHIADISTLKQAFREGHDIHAMTAAEVFDIPLDQMTSDYRRRAKAINYGVIYGMSGFGLARNLRIPRADANVFITRYFERFPGIRDYMDRTKDFAKKHGFVQTLFGRRIHTPEINSKGPRVGLAQRAAINAPIQGTAADIIRRAMIRMQPVIADLPAMMLLQVHDELLFEVEEAAADELVSRASEVMEKAAEPSIKLAVELTVDAGRGKNWAQAH
ncbi:MAG: DNA polymerase I [Aestuariivita sp.]|nr:DNA polymerase I [Aestuariivita sp.]MCY4201191.1 DNA polymerase I [Aestuariivita sp.]